MPRALPPLNGLRAFEAAGRHLSFSKAAQELNVTPAAISHQIKGLEEHLQVQLFRREPRTLLLTDAGQRALPEIRAAFEHLAEAVEGLRDASEANQHLLTVSAVPSLSSKWLVPRLDRFRRQHPEIDVRLDATGTVVDFSRDQDIDLGLRYGTGGYPGLEAIRLASGDVIPVCSPAVAYADPPLKQPADLANRTLIHTSWGSGATDPDWGEWLRSAGVSNIDSRRGPRFNHTEYAVQAALQDQGVALAARVLMEDDLAAGRLVAPFDAHEAGAGNTAGTGFSYWIVAPKAKLKLRRVRAFRDWLLDEMAATREERGQDPADVPAKPSDSEALS
ncbi:transcriptional regulator GcvA [Rhodovibrio salinarum]|uniref:Transcriptional regulator GcvA n=2 Tax=Rhodovibrio salinarum TaxID=1087 RepID=A0A934QFB5_9PROT|nr:transcriptional regulator GcvA [Rhodovibrio salinarum]MBK1695884.1 transcriptional regulator GcvA [Rhodovibrio salinarum]